MARYKFQTGGVGVMDTERGGAIPPNTNNRHWREYQEWLALGNVTDPADPIIPPDPAPSELEDGIGAVSRAEMNNLKGYLRTRFGYQ